MKEIERKFLVNEEVFDLLKTLKPTSIHQGYLSYQENSTVRVRIRDNEAFLTIKSKTIGIRREEFEYSIPVHDAEQMMILTQERQLKKERYVYEFHGKTWEIDVFHGKNEGLVLAEIELLDENETFDLPSWCGLEVSEDPRYFNSNLAGL
jgi:adenylate cyclase